MLKELDEKLSARGFCVRGAFSDNGRTLVLIGNVGSDMWDHFGEKPNDWVEPDPLDQWCKEFIDEIAKGYEASAIYPFEGPKFPPFQQWALRAEDVHKSPLGMLIHPEYGLWHAYRAAFLFKEEIPGIEEVEKQKSPCEKCFSKPCLMGCPVDAYTGKSFKASRCLDYLNKNLEGACMHKGCLARMACPVGSDYAYKVEHRRFHQERFLDT